MRALVAAVRAVGGEVTHELGIINAVGAGLTATQLRRLEANDDTLRVQPNRAAGVSAVKKGKKPSEVTKTLGREKAATGSGEDAQYDEAAVWEAAEQRSLQITSDWKIAAQQAVKDARVAVRTAKDHVARVQAVQVREDAKAWKKTLRSWSREWARDAFLKGSKPTVFPGLIGAGALHDVSVTGVGVTVAVVDTGLWTDKGLRQGSRGNPRILAQ